MFTDGRRRLVVGTVAVLALAGCGAGNSGEPASSSPTAAATGDAAFRDTFRELVETNTTPSAGSCTLAAQRMADRLKAGGYSDKDIVQFTPPGRPKDGGLVATLGGSDTNAKPVLLLAHLDVVEAKREDWQRDPFTLVEENGYFYGRGTYDDKSMAAIFVDSMIRYRAEGFLPKAPVRIALTCGEEGGDQENGVKWLRDNRPELLDARLVLNEGAGGQLDQDGKPVTLEVQAAQKQYQDFTLEVTDPGGHSSQPGPFNAIAALSAGLDRLAAYRFPVQLNETVRQNFTALAPLNPGEVGDAMRAIVADPNDAAAADVLSRSPVYNAALRTTCIPTQITGGHAKNAQPQRVTANVNCRIAPNASPQDVQRTLNDVLAEPRIAVTPTDPFSTDIAKVADLTPAIVDPIRSIGQRIWPGITVVPFMSAGATDAIFFTDTPVYGISGILSKPNDTFMHGLNERVPVKSLYDGRAFLYDLTKAYANG
ncbi:M20/M25/M40 family metallo-hydrolase [Tsukamurella strandjordii]|uniref:M20/M25/M40 family metallo-hydrolase n=1 Tax=Tsukamurella strandjordii TaxID=147577 RepID=A0AA90N7X0_9ACTN|nr:M20/M25/M40 family metallo-hydrolase [Tsukamurella strandjordii]MDP0397277.1 M20/M25/M40 family metallo-hydrolase [Tsukamurella strandjordii]